MLGFTVGFAMGVSLGMVVGGLLAPSKGETFRENVRRQIEIAKVEAVEAAHATEQELLRRFEEAKQ
jgi:gas vesicle protein